MPKRILNFEFPYGISTIYVNGKRYNREEFYKAQQLEKRRNSNTGKFQSKLNVSVKHY